MKKYLKEIEISILLFMMMLIISHPKTVNEFIINTIALVTVVCVGFAIGVIIFKL